MQESRIDNRRVRNALKTKRNSLFANFSKNPSNTDLSLQIRHLDDRLADLDSGLSVKTSEDHSKPNSIVHCVPQLGFKSGVVSRTNFGVNLFGRGYGRPINSANKEIIWMGAAESLGRLE